MSFWNPRGAVRPWKMLLSLKHTSETSRFWMSIWQSLRLKDSSSFTLPCVFTNPLSFSLWNTNEELSDPPLIIFHQIFHIVKVILSIFYTTVKGESLTFFVIKMEKSNWYNSSKSSFCQHSRLPSFGLPGCTLDQKTQWNRMNFSLDPVKMGNTWFKIWVACLTSRRNRRKRITTVFITPIPLRNATQSQVFLGHLSLKSLWIPGLFSLENYLLNTRTK